jgi:hypothetical protein
VSRPLIEPVTGPYIELDLSTTDVDVSGGGYMLEVLINIVLDEKE